MKDKAKNCYLVTLTISLALNILLGLLLALMCGPRKTTQVLILMLSLIVAAHIFAFVAVAFLKEKLVRNSILIILIGSTPWLGFLMAGMKENVSKKVEPLSELPKDVEKFLSGGSTSYKGRQIAETPGGTKLLIDYAVKHYWDVDRVETASSALLFAKDDPRPILKRMLASDDVNKKGVSIEIIGMLRYSQFREAMVKLKNDKTKYRETTIGDLASRAIGRIDYGLQNPKEVEEAQKLNERLTRPR